MILSICHFIHLYLYPSATDLGNGFRPCCIFNFAVKKMSFIQKIEINKTKILGFSSPVRSILDQHL